MENTKPFVFYPQKNYQPRNMIFHFCNSLKNCLKCFSNLKNFSLLHVSVYDWFDWFYSCEGYGKNLHTWKYACNDPLNMWIACLPSITPSSSAPSGASSTKSWVYQISKITQKLGKISWLHCKIEKPLQISL